MDLSVIEKNDLETLIRDIIQEELKPVIDHLNVSTPHQDLIKISEACKLLNVSKATIHKWKREGRIPFHRMSNRIYFKKEELMEAVKKVQTRTIF